MHGDLPENIAGYQITHNQPQGRYLRLTLCRHQLAPQAFIANMKSKGFQESGRGLANRRLQPLGHVALPAEVL